MLRFLPVLVMTGLLCVESSYAQLRTIPPNAKRATVGQPQVLPNVELNGKMVKLAPGGVIYDENNRMIVHNALPPGADVAFTPAMNGDVARIYIMTPAERAQFGKKK
jgi:hypothetical protein